MKLLAAFALAAALAAGPAPAQTTQTPSVPPAGSTGSTIDGGLPDKTASTTAVGQTKPPGTAAPGTNARLEEESRKLDRRIQEGICTGCK